MAGVISNLATNPAGFALAANAAKYPPGKWERVAATDPDGVWHGYREIAAPANVLRLVLVTPSAAYLATMATTQTAFLAAKTADTSARADIAALRAAAATAAGGGAALTPQQVARLLVALGVR